MAAKPDRPSRLAVLIDGENVPPRIVDALFREVAAIGEASVRRIYGDFSGSRLKGWAEVSSRYTIVPQQNFIVGAGKNASDIALVIDAMDLLHTRRFDAFCLVSSDSDFTRLASRIREQGIDVYGFGESKTPESFRTACKRFYYVDSPKIETPLVVASHATSLPIDQPKRHAAAATDYIHTAISELEDRQGWYCLSAVGSRLAARMPHFDTRTYGCPNLTSLVEGAGAFDIQRREQGVFVRAKADPGASS